MTRQSDRRGFILVISLLTLAVIATLVTSSLLSSRGRIKLAANLKLAAEAESLADGLVHLMILDRLRALEQGQRSASRLPWDGAPLHCSMADGARVSLRSEDEGGKIDLNAAAGPLLLAMLEGLQLSPAAAARIVQAIDSYRSEPRTGGRRGMITVHELGTALPSEPLLVRLILPHVTVHARMPGIDLSVASLETRSLLTRNESRAGGLLPFQQPSASRAFRFKAQVEIHGVRFQRVALVELKPDARPSYQVHEWTRGRADRGDDRRGNADVSCFH